MFLIYGGFFLFWFFCTLCNGVTIFHDAFETSANFPGLHEVTTRSRRPKFLNLTLEEIKR
ncbi:MAG: hypothetical protein CME21_11280 [Gemmatimonadetes bacterium]|nr:hypothetical protein [Gemmatimonadota bacterium]HCK12345.1 hypothetical protein [Candidatus Latescibacterota bacterium]